MLSRSACVVLLVLAASPCRAQTPEPAALDPALPYVAERGNPVTYDVDYSVVVTAPYKAKKLRVWMPLPPGNAGQEIERLTLSTFPQEVEPQFATEPTFGNRFAYFEFASPQGGMTIRQQLKIKVWELRWNVESANVQLPTMWPGAFDRFRRSESQAVVIGDAHRELLGRLLPERRAPAGQLNAAMHYALDKFKYDHAVASLAADSTHALRTGGGHCSDYHGFCAAVGRALGFPTRVTYGINPFPKASPSHCKLEAFLPPYGWVSFDVSETQKLLAAVRNDAKLTATERDRFAAAAVARLQSGFRDNTWYLQTVGSDYDLVPAASRRVPVVRTIYAEADGAPLPDPDPSDPGETTFAWMTSYRATPDRQVPYAFADVTTLESK